MTLELAADYKQRILIPARTYPLLMCWLVFAPPGTPCALRKQCAGDLVDASEQTVGDTTTLKFRILFLKELVHAKETGCLSEALLTLGLATCTAQETNKLGCVWAGRAHGNPGSST